MPVEKVTVFKIDDRYTVDSRYLEIVGTSETLRDIRTSTYQICRIGENTNRTTTFHKLTCNLTALVRNIH